MRLYQRSDSASVFKYTLFEGYPKVTGEPIFPDDADYSNVVVSNIALEKMLEEIISVEKAMEEIVLFEGGRSGISNSEYLELQKLIEEASPTIKAIIYIRNAEPPAKYILEDLNPKFDEYLQMRALAEGE